MLAHPASGPRFVLAHPGTGSFVQEVARALHEGGALARFATTVADDPNTPWRRALAAIPQWGGRIDRELRRRQLPAWLLQETTTFPGPELLRVLASRIDRQGQLAHRVWERSERSFDRWVATRQLHGADAVYGYEHAALHTFRAARERGLRAVLDLPAPAQEQVAAVFARELQRWPELSTDYLRELAQQRESRAAVVREQIELATTVVANSRLTLESYRQQGYPIAHGTVVPLAGPQPITLDALAEVRASGPLRLLFAGTLDVRKGGHYLLEAFAREPAMRDAELTVCGRVALPEAFIKARAARVHFRGHVPGPELRAVYLAHDALVLPTLSDGFGLVVTEAIAHGLPVITTEQCGAAELIIDGVHGFITQAGNIEALRATLAHCAEHRDALHAMRPAVLSHAHTRTWESYRADLRAALALARAATTRLD